MKKISAIVIISAAILLFQAKNTAYADPDRINLNSLFRANNQSVIAREGEDEEKEFERINENSFMLKGAVEASTSNSVTINSQQINLDSSVTGDIKIVGEIKPGAYVMVKGLIQNSNYYATKIVVNNRNKEKDEDELEEENENELEEETEENELPTPTPSPTLAISPTLTPTPSEPSDRTSLEESSEGGVETNFDMKTLLSEIRDILLSIRQFVLSV